MTREHCYSLYFLTTTSSYLGILRELKGLDNTISVDEVRFKRAERW